MAYKKLAVGAATVLLLTTILTQSSFDYYEDAQIAINDEKKLELISLADYKEQNSFTRKYPVISRGNVSRNTESEEKPKPKEEVQLLPWYGKAEKIFSIGTTATVIDVYTGLTLTVKRTYGYNHADVEALTSEDTQTLNKIAGGSWNWTRRPAIVEVNGVRIAASITAMPHAGLENAPVNSTVKGRSGGFGRGVNLDTVKGNNMDGHFDIHFYGSKTHSSNKVDKAHQDCIQKAYKSGK